MPDEYAIRAGYRARLTPEYFPDDQERTWQPDVYRDLGRIAERLGCERLIDLGCGNARKLIEHRERFELVGIDIGANIDACQSQYDFGTWIEHDLGEPGPLPLGEEELRRSALVCADVIEHIPDALALVKKLASALKTADALLISTPDRVLARGEGDEGPPGNPAHVREWTIRELGALLRRSGLVHGSLGLTRPHLEALHHETIFGVYVRDEADLDVVEDALIDHPTAEYRPPPAPPLRSLAGDVRRFRAARRAAKQR
jgi:SAM-dependent methyltransferase